MGAEVGPVTVTVAVGPGTVTVAVGPGTVTVAVGPGTVAVAVAVTVLVAITILMGCLASLAEVEASLGVSRPPTAVRTRVVTVATEASAVKPARAWAWRTVGAPRCLRRRLLNMLAFLQARSEALAVAPDRVSS